MRLHLPLHGGDLGSQDGQDGHLGAYRGRVRAGDHRRLAQVLGPQRGLDLRGLAADVAPARVAQRRGDLLGVQPGRRDRVGCRIQQLQRVRRSQVVVGGQRGREEVQQRPAQPQQVAGLLPDQGLVRPGDHLDGLGQVAIASDRTQLMPVGAHHVGQGVRIPRVALGPGHATAFPEAGHLQRVDRTW
jgi:hypothetical protein